MITDAEIREQGYVYFLAEAPELLQTIEQELLSFAEGEGNRKNKVHSLMRATHTLKGGAATVGLETIQMIAHSLEDVFKALYNPDIVIDADLNTLLLKAYECLRLAITAELTSTNVDVEEIIQRVTAIIVQLQEKLGDVFGDDNYIPTSQELGFDVVQSIFEVGVQKRLESIATAINNPPDNAEFIDFLNSEAEVFLGLAESLDLSGLGELAKTIMAALQANPAQVQQIATIALQDLQAIQTTILSGDRAYIPTLSQDWQNLTQNFSNNLATDQFDKITNEFYEFLTTSSNNTHECIKPETAKLYIKIVQCILGWFHHQRDIPKQELNLSLLVSKIDRENKINYIETWLKEFLSYVQNPEDSYNLCVYRHGIIFIVLLAVAKFEYDNQKTDNSIVLTQKLQSEICTLAKEYKNYPPITAQEKNWLDHPNLQKLLVIKEISKPAFHETDNLLESIWGGEAEDKSNQSEEMATVDDSDNVSTLSTGEDTVVELMPEVVNNINEQIEDKIQISPNKKARQHSFVRVDVESLRNLNYLAGELLIHQKKRNFYDEQMQEMVEQFLLHLNKHQTVLNQLRDLPLHLQSRTAQATQNFATVNFDSLEMDVYTEFHLSLYEAIEEALQLQEITESLDLIIKQATQLSEKKQNLVFNIIDNLVEARMLPLGDILNRFTPMVKKLGNIYHKNVTLQLVGTEVLVDKAIAEKLYEPLLHLVRNAFDHGIEPPEVRRELGKPEQGLIAIRAYHQSSQTIIEVQDDGQGLNLESIRKKAIEMNLVTSHEHESELLDLMFAPGLSTAEQVSNISGRGMGLDIVRSQMQSLNGSISVQTWPQKGTKFILKIPFSMTTDQLMLVQAGGVVYALLLDSVEKILIPTSQQIKELEGKRVLHWHTDQDETLVTLFQLSELMSYNCSYINSHSLNNSQNTLDTRFMNNPVLLLKHNQGIFGLEVDQVIGEQELVIRPLGNAIAPPKYVYGCSSSANGNLILVIDGSLLLESLNLPATPAITSLVSQPEPTVEDELVLTPLNNRESLNQNPEANYQSPNVVLIVDDAISLRQTLSLTLQRSGYQVIQAQNGVEALEQLQKNPHIQLIISDLEMPRMNGFELLTNLTQNPNLAKIPVVILSSRSAEKHRQLAQELGAKAYLTKPYLEYEFLSTIGSLIHN
ncbi:hybrid sensor histidine kinase/response regulator [Nostoc sp. FACHB-152]|uniref:hybrid sensor histidine kinase/response regulator n=1 Tax=unclassified Nostoc TaxID=2593658 RepID=UPI001683F055|nr:MULTISPECIES: hybrid sensor histidine kinase/response regulator [unclassified Nostoc]MBD2449424.1 hybrid sensor histidine kinase/response regulator [Nostoc sp. FACHB-152]MBD2470811.1 hybrid sensor histidine kinase/response regulator [Nostoc sp. FACHB-145]